MNTIAVALVCAVLLVVQQTATAISCYSCATGTEGCGTSSFSKTGAGVVYSDSGATYCTKTVYSSNSNSASRSFSASGSCSATTSGTSGNIAYTTYCCSSDLCNSAHMNGINFLLAIGAAVIGVYFAK